jgi:hypothetical protein
MLQATACSLRALPYAKALRKSNQHICCTYWLRKIVGKRCG